MNQAGRPTRDMLDRRRIELDAAAAIARRAGEVALRHHQRVGAQLKADRSLVTEADREAERLIRADLQRRFPDDTIIGEEQGRTGLPDAERVWFIDPIDGTNNYVHGLPFWCVAIGLLEAGQPVLGVLHEPLARRTYRGAVGLGAWSNEDPLQPWPEDGPFNSNDPVVLSLELAGAGLAFGARVRVRILGSAQLHFGLVAAGTVRAGLWVQDHGWDVVAGAALCLAAGCLVTTFGGATPPYLDLMDGSALAWGLCAAPPASMPYLLEAVAPAITAALSGGGVGVGQSAAAQPVLRSHS